MIGCEIMILSPGLVFFTYAKFFRGKNCGSERGAPGKNFDILKMKTLDFLTVFRDFIWKLYWRIMYFYLQNLGGQVWFNWKLRGLGRRLWEKFWYFQYEKLDFFAEESQKSYFFGTLGDQVRTNWKKNGGTRADPPGKLSMFWEDWYSGRSLWVQLDDFHSVLFKICPFRYWTFKKVQVRGRSPWNFLELKKFFHWNFVQIWFFSME